MGENVYYRREITVCRVMLISLLKQGKGHERRVDEDK